MAGLAAELEEGLMVKIAHVHFLSLFPFASPCSCHLGGAAQVGAVPWV